MVLCGISKRFLCWTAVGSGSEHTFNPPKNLHVLNVANSIFEGLDELVKHK
jgi:hypothetical protein